MPARLQSNSYGKGEVRITRLFRRPDATIDVCQMTVDITLHGDFADSYIAGDNTRIIATDSMRNTVYVLARRHEFATPEDFAHLLVDHFLATYAHVSGVEIAVEAQPYARLTVDGAPHPHAFQGGGTARHTCHIGRQRNGPTIIHQGIDGLLVLKATASEFANFISDEYRTLPDSHDRIFSTVVKAAWQFNDRPPDYRATRAAATGAILDTFAKHYSLAVQQTLYAMGEAVLDAVPAAARITLTLPNKHHLPFNLAPFKLDNPNLVFHPIDEPYGLIEGTIERTA